MALVESVVSSSLLTLGEDNTALRNTLIRMALTANSPASAGVLQSIFALCSLRLHGPHHKAVSYQIAALRLLRESVGQDFGSKETCQHVAAGMLLGLYEVRPQFYDR